MEFRLKRESEEVDDFMFDSDDENAAIATLLASERLLPARRRGKRGGSQHGRAPTLARASSHRSSSAGAHNDKTCAPAPILFSPWRKQSPPGKTKRIRQK
jgi:hypothetical protein